MSNPTVAIVAQGAMGAGIGARLAERGLSVITSLAGRSTSSVDRAKAAGMKPATDLECAHADFFLSICPPSDALALAEKMAAVISGNSHKPIYVDCNAVSPRTKIRIGEILTRAGARFIDVGIVGLPPGSGKDPMLYASGPDAAKFDVFKNFGLQLGMIDGPIGAASALKMSYAGITKGMMALGSMMMLAADRAGVADELRAELERSQAPVFQVLSRSIPGIFDKAYRFVGEMGEIAEYSGDDPSASKLYLAMAEFYTGLAADHAGEHQKTAALLRFLKAGASKS